MSVHSPVDVSVIVFAGDQHHMLHGCLASIERAAAHATRSGHSLEVLLVLYESSAETEAWVREQVGNVWRPLRFSESGLGATRNAAIKASSGRHIAMVDGWDLWSENWIENAIGMAEIQEAIWHPELIVRFGKDYISSQGYGIVWQPDGEASDFDYVFLLTHNPYSTGFLARRSVYEAVPFPVEDRERGWFDIDWWWMCNVVGAGFHHRTVPGTFHYQPVDSQNRPLSEVRHSTFRRFGPTTLSRRSLSPIASASVSRLSQRD